jgi:hypothetical protein
MACSAITLRRRFVPNESCLCPTLEFKESRMAITMFTLQGLLAPLEGLWAWMAGHRRAQPAAQERPARPQSASTVPIGALSARSPKVRALAARRPLRVVRVAEAGMAKAHAGRMVISGRLADVCAELDRLAALEAAAG